MLRHWAHKVSNHIMFQLGSSVVTATRLGTGLLKEQWLQYGLSLEPVQPPVLCAAGDLRLQIPVSHRSGQCSIDVKKAWNCTQNPRRFQFKHAGKFILLHFLTPTCEYSFRRGYEQSRCVSFTLRPRRILLSVRKLRGSQRPRGLRRGSAAARLLRLRVRIRQEAWMSVCCE